MLLCISPPYDVLLFSLIIYTVARLSWWRVVILRGLRWERFPTWFLIPVHVIIYVARSLFSYTTPYTNISLHTIPESLFPYLRNRSISDSISKLQLDSLTGLAHMRLEEEMERLALSAKPRKASCIDENLITLTSLNEENTVLNCTYKRNSESVQVTWGEGTS